MSKLSIIKAPKSDDWRVQLAAHIRMSTYRPQLRPTPEQAKNDAKLLFCIHTGVMRSADLTYNPEAPHFQRVPCGHAWHLLRQQVEEAAAFCHLWRQRELLGHYPNFAEGV